MKKKMKQSLKAKLLCGANIALVLMVALAIFQIVLFNVKTKGSLESATQLLYYAEGFEDASVYLTTEARTYAVTGDKKHYDNYWNEINNSKNRELYTGLIKEIGITSDEQVLLEKVNTLSSRLAVLEDESMQKVAEGDLLAATNILYSEEYVTMAEEVLSTTTAFSNAIQKRVLDESEVYQGYTNISVMFAICSMAVILITLVYLVFFVVVQLVKPITIIKNKMGELSEGNLHGEFNLEVNTSEIGETAQSIYNLQEFQNNIIEDIRTQLGEMARGNFNVDSSCPQEYRGDYTEILTSLKGIVSQLSSTIGEINTAAAEVNVGSDQVSAAAQALSQGATEQAASVEELTATIEDVSEHIKEIAENARRANKSSAETEATMDECNSKMHAMINAMTEISETSERISNIIKTIDDIAFQTNILALNAAVEAARAGQAGKGFAVVADEVRNLASKSAEAVKTTTELIESSVQAVNVGQKIADETAEYLNVVVAQSKEVAEAVGRISEAAENQSVAVNQATIGMEQINVVVQTNSATAEESAAAAEQLNGQAITMKALVDKFILHA